MAGHAASTERDADKDVAVLLCGSTDENAVRAQLERAVARFGAERLVLIAVRAAPTARLRRVREPDLAVEVYPARWDRHGRSAGYRRNVRTLDRLADFPHRYVIAFSIASRGTQHTIDQARQGGIPVRVVRPRSSTTLTRSARTRPSMRDDTRAPAPMSRAGCEFQR